MGFARGPTRGQRRSSRIGNICERDVGGLSAGNRLGHRGGLDEGKLGPRLSQIPYYLAAESRDAGRDVGWVPMAPYGVEGVP